MSKCHAIAFVSTGHRSASRMADRNYAFLFLELFPTMSILAEGEIGMTGRDDDVRRSCNRDERRGC